MAANLSGSKTSRQTGCRKLLPGRDGPRPVAALRRIAPLGMTSCPGARRMPETAAAVLGHSRFRAPERETRQEAARQQRRTQDLDRSQGGGMKLWTAPEVGAVRAAGRRPARLDPATCPRNNH